MLLVAISSPEFHAALSPQSFHSTCRRRANWASTEQHVLRRTPFSIPEASAVKLCPVSRPGAQGVVPVARLSVRHPSMQCISA